MRDDVLDIESLLVFALVVRERSISSAAKKLGRSKQSVHRQIKNFEIALSVKLLQKIKRSITPTRIGLRLYNHAEKIIDESRAISDFLKSPKIESAGKIRITAPPLLAEIFLSPILIEFLKLNQDTRIESVLTNDLLNLTDNNLDIALRIGPNRFTETENYDSLLLGKVSRVLYASPSYLQERGMPKRIQDLKNHRTLHFGSLNENNRAHWQLEKTIEHLPVLTAANSKVILDATIQGQGIALLPEMLCADLLRQKKLVEILPQQRVDNIPVYILYRKALSQNSLIYQCVVTIQKAAEKSGFLN